MFHKIISHHWSGPTTLQGSVDTLFRWGGERFHDFTANLFENYTLINWQCSAYSMCDTFTIKFHDLQIPPLLLLLPNFITYKFQSLIEIRLYLRISILENSNTTDLQPNSGTCKFYYLQIHTTHGQKWNTETGTGRQYFTDIIGLSSNTVT